MYDIDQGTKTLLEQVLNMAQRTVDSQYDDDVADSMQLLLADVAEEFGIVSSTVTELGQVVPINPANLHIVADNTLDPKV
jgi:phage portal protein BeeE